VHGTRIAKSRRFPSHPEPHPPSVRKIWEKPIEVGGRVHSEYTQQIRQVNIITIKWSNDMNAIAAPRRDIMTLPATIKKYNSEKNAWQGQLPARICSPFSVLCTRSRALTMKTMTRGRAMGKLKEKLHR